MIRAIKGIKDILPDQAPRWAVIESTAHTLAKNYGFSEIRIPIFEQTALYSRSIGEATDVVEKEMYTFPDRDGTSLTLRPEGTAGVVRAYLEHHLGNTIATRKLYYLGPMFRHERPQAGRFRQFHQFGVEAFGSADPMMDVEVIALLWDYFTNLHLPELSLYVNSIGDLDDRARYVTRLRDVLNPLREQLCGNCQRRLDTNPLRVLDCKVPACQTHTQDAPVLIEDLSPASLAHFESVQAGLTLLDIPFTVNPRLVRGLDYYSQTTFEITSTGLGAQNTIGAGGRYDGLVTTLGGPPTPAVGFAVGLERVNLLMPATRVPSSIPVTFVAGFGDHGRPAGLKLLRQLRSRSVRTETDYRASTLKSHLKAADRLGAIAAIIVGDDEAMTGNVLVRNMRTKHQVTIPISTVAEAVEQWVHHGKNPFEIS